MALVIREPSRPLDVFDNPFDRFFEHWPETFAWPMLAWRDATEGVLRVDEYIEDRTLVVRADAPGIDPDKDLEVSASEGYLHIGVDRHEEEKPEGREYLRHEMLHHGQLHRDLALPEGAKDSELKANYTNGMLEVRVPLPEEEAKREVKRIPVHKA